MTRTIFNMSSGMAALLLVAGLASASQTIHYSDDYTDGVLDNGVGSLNNVDTNIALRTQQAWRNTSQTYFGLDPAVAYDGAGGFGTAKQFRVTTTNTAVLGAGNVWVFDASYIADVATNGSQFFSHSPGTVIEWDWLTAGDFSFSSSAVLKVGSAVSTAGAQGALLSTSYPNGADPQVEPTALGSNIADAGLPAALNTVLRGKFVYQSVTVGTAGGFTRRSTQAFSGTTNLGSAAYTDGGAGTFRSDYSGGLFAQMMTGSGSGNVTYASGHGGGTDVAYSSAYTDLELGLTNLVFKQVRRSDFNTDGTVNFGADGSTLVANAGGTGKSFFQGDATGDGTVTYGADGSVLVGQVGTDILGLDQALARYYPSDGHIEVSSNHAGSIRILSSTGALLFANATPLASMPNGQFQDPGATTEVNWLTFNAAGLGTGSPAILDNFNLGNLLNSGLTQAQFAALNIRLAGAFVGAGEYDFAVQYVPEPSSLILLGLGAVGLLRRRSRMR